MVAALHLLAPPPGRAEVTFHQRFVKASGQAATIISSAATYFDFGFGYFLQALIALHGLVVWSVYRTLEGARISYVPDDSHRELVAVEPVPVPALLADSLVSPSGISSGNLLLEALARSVSTLRALDTSLNRLYTAMARGDGEAAERQRAYIADTLLPASERIMAEASAHLAELMLHTVDGTLTLEEVQAYHASQRASGFPAPELPVFRMMEATPCDMMKADMLVLSAQVDRPEYTLIADGLAPMLEVFQDTTAFLRGIALSPDSSSLVAVEGCSMFRRGDTDASTSVTLTDAIVLAYHLFLGGSPPRCREASDSNDDGGVDVSDAVFVLNWLFLGGAAPPAPGPQDCGLDPSTSPAYLGCERSQLCE
jgi:hypothetical protein